jgi:hypothetical protein
MLIPSQPKSSRIASMTDTASFERGHTHSFPGCNPGLSGLPPRAKHDGPIRGETQTPATIFSNFPEGTSVPLRLRDEHPSRQTGLLQLRLRDPGCLRCANRRLCLPCSWRPHLHGNASSRIPPATNPRVRPTNHHWERCLDRGESNPMSGRHHR